MNIQQVNRHWCQEYIGKLFWALAPLVWGLITYFLAFGPGAALHIGYSIRLLAGIAFLTFYFYKTLESARLKTIVFLFDYPLIIPSWKLLIGLTSFLLLIHTFFFSWGVYPVFDSLVFGVFGSSCLEELLSRTLFIKYRMKPAEFIGFNILSSCVFTLMHAGFESIPPSWYELFFMRGHFEFAFLLGLIAYKTQRIEIVIIIHMLSNLLRYTVPFLLIKQELPVLGLFLTCLELIVVAGMTYTTKSMSSEKDK